MKVTAKNPTLWEIAQIRVAIYGGDAYHNQVIKIGNQGIGVETVKKRNKIIWISLASVVAVVLIGIFVAGMYFYNVAVARNKKDFINNNTTISKTDPLRKQKLWYRNVKSKRGRKRLRLIILNWTPIILRRIRKLIKPS